MKEIRIYYESLEQAYNYIYPIIVPLIINENKIKLVKRPRRPDQFKKGVLFAIQSLTTPDILITGVYNHKEYPLAILEFTEAVTTEDHELQRSYGAVAAYLSSSFYIKISGEKKSEKEFGGAYYNSYTTPKILQNDFNYFGFIIADWTIDDPYNLTRNDSFPSCPPRIPILIEVIETVINAFLNNETNWFKSSLQILNSKQPYIDFQKHVDEASGSEELLSTWKEREVRNRNLNKLRYFVRNNWVGAKINRFSHAMDPDRGILTFLSFVFSKKFKIFGIYALVRPRSTNLLKSEITDLNSLKLKFAEALKKDKGGIPDWFESGLKEYVNNANSINQIIDIQEFLTKNFNKLFENKVVLTIVFFLNGLFLNHNGIKLIWDRKKLLGGKSEDSLELLGKYLQFNNTICPTDIEVISEEVDEDEVTYAIVHKVLIPNKFRIVSISYPGSQGGGAVLPKPELGKAQPREYPDIIALPPQSNSQIDVLLNESKGMFKQASIERDTSKILRYKNEKNLINALKETLVVAQVIDKNDTIRNILIGVAFGVNSNTNTTWRPNEVDFIFRIVDRKKWAIGIFNQSLSNLIPIIEGNTDFSISIQAIEY